VNNSKGIIWRLAISIVLGASAVLLFILNRDEEVVTAEEMQRQFSVSVQSIDAEVDGILEKFGVEKGWIKRSEIPATGGGLARIERHVLIPPTVVPVLVNREFNLLARRFQGRVVATENLKENTVTIHILLHQSIIHTIILKIHHNIQNKGTREQAAEV
jgi:hypothetical protein